MIAIFVREINAYLHSFIAYVVIGFFLVGMGLLVWVYPGSNVLDYGYADLSTLFTLGPYVMMFLIPAVTMKMFAEEKRSGTFELLMTHPLTDWQIILGKYFAAVAIVILSVFLTSTYYFTLSYLGSPPGNVDTPGTIGSYTGLILLGAAFVSFGLCASTISSNQVIAFIIGAFLCYFTYEGLSAIADLIPWSETSLFIEHLGLISHYDVLGKGLIHIRDVVYLLGVAYLGLVITNFILSKRNW